MIDKTLLTSASLRPIQDKPIVSTATKQSKPLNLSFLTTVIFHKLRSFFAKLFSCFLKKRKIEKKDVTLIEKNLKEIEESKGNTKNKHNNYIDTNIFPSKNIQLPASQQNYHSISSQNTPTQPNRKADSTLNSAQMGFTAPIKAAQTNISKQHSSSTTIPSSLSSVKVGSGNLSVKPSPLSPLNASPVYGIPPTTILSMPAAPIRNSYNPSTTANSTSGILPTPPSASKPAAAKLPVINIQNNNKEETVGQTQKPILIIKEKNGPSKTYSEGKTFILNLLDQRALNGELILPKEIELLDEETVKLICMFLNELKNDYSSFKGKKIVSHAYTIEGNLQTHSIDIRFNFGYESTKGCKLVSGEAAALIKPELLNDLVITCLSKGCHARHSGAKSEEKYSILKFRLSKELESKVEIIPPPPANDSISIKSTTSTRTSSDTKQNATISVTALPEGAPVSSASRIAPIDTTLTAPVTPIDPISPGSATTPQTTNAAPAVDTTSAPALPDAAPVSSASPMAPIDTTLTAPVTPIDPISSGFATTPQTINAVPPVDATIVNTNQVASNLVKPKPFSKPSPRTRAGQFPHRGALDLISKASPNQGSKPPEKFTVFQCTSTEEILGDRTNHTRKNLEKSGIKNSVILVNQKTYRLVESTLKINSQECLALGNLMTPGSDLEIVLVDPMGSAVIQTHYLELKNQLTQGQTSIDIAYSTFNLVSLLFTKDNFEKRYNSVVQDAKDDKLTGVGKMGIKPLLNFNDGPICIPIDHFINAKIGYCAERSVLFASLIALLKNDGLLPKNTEVRYVRYNRLKYRDGKPVRGVDGKPKITGAHAVSVVTIGKESYLSDAMWGKFLNFNDSEQLKEIREYYPEIIDIELRRIASIQMSFEDLQPKDSICGYPIFSEKKEDRLRAWNSLKSDFILYDETTDKYKFICKLPRYKLGQIRFKALTFSEKTIINKIKNYSNLSEFDRTIDILNQYRLISTNEQAAIQLVKDGVSPYGFYKSKLDYYICLGKYSYEGGEHRVLQKDRPLIPQIEAYLKDHDA